MTSFDTSSKDAHREIIFYCPELGVHNKNKFLITLSMTWDHTIGSIKNDLRKALDGADPEIWPLDINGEPFYDCENKLYNFDAIKKGEHLIISLKDSRRIRSEFELEMKLYLEADEVAVAGQALKVVSRPTSYLKLLEGHQATSSALQEAKENTLKHIWLTQDTNIHPENRPCSPSQPPHDPPPR
jgi:hypothetical protein